MDIDFIEQFICSDCGFVYGEMLAFHGSHNHHTNRACPSCGAGAVSSLECVYHVSQALLIRF
ncbi:hypothetical protein ACFFJT_14640 [Dyella flava]|uniref:C2H2-type domain-containing protein n=1 Tax=Dyella flava TaxID=1920170 RepID=A0ABS2JZG0_9GAMM|nr:hypothetical protein [Dyella flava]MBM7123852.1 hypothetical protein [Dyella flava]